MAEDKIRIMHVAQAAGGVSRYLQYLLKYLSQDKFENILVCSQDYKPEEFRDYGCKLEQIEMQREIGFQDFKATIMIHGLIKRYRPHIVYAHSSKAGVIARVANINLDSACIYNPHGWSFNMRVSYKKQITYTLIERIMSHFCCKIVCISDAEKQSALNNRICREDKLEVIFNGIDIEAYDTYDHGDVTRLGLGIPKDGFVVGMVGRLCTQKAPDVFIHMAKMIKAQVPNSHFIMVGEGEMLDNVKKYAHENSLSECLHITGWVKNPLSYVRLFDVAVLLSRWEGFGLAIPEYMAANKPVVATAVDAIPNLISDGVNGLLVPEDDAYAACEAVVRLKNDLKLRTQLTNQGAKDVRRNYDAKRVSEQHAQIFASLNYLGDKMVISERIKKVVFRNKILYLFAIRLKATLKCRGGYKLENNGKARLKKDIQGQKNYIQIKEGCTLHDTTIHIRGDNNRIIFGKNCWAGANCSFWIEGSNIEILIGEGTTFTHTVHFCAQENDTLIAVGKDCMFSNNIIVRTSDSHPIYDLNTGKRINMAKNVEIGEHVWIAPNTKIMKGAVIGRGTVIGSNSMVTKSIPSNVLAVGHPATVVKHNINWTREKIF